MSPGIQIRFKNIGSIFLIVFFIGLNGYSQMQELLPEYNLNSGLQSNAVRVVRIDKKSRIWIGTDNGLNILNATLPQQKEIITTIGNESIWDIAFTDSLILIGTRYNGLFIFQQQSGKLYQHIPSSEVNLIRKIKVFDKNIFILTNKQVYKLVDRQLKVLPIHLLLSVIANSVVISVNL